MFADLNARIIGALLALGAVLVLAIYIQMLRADVRASRAETTAETMRADTNVQAYQHMAALAQKQNAAVDELAVDAQAAEMRRREAERVLNLVAHDANESIAKLQAEAEAHRKLPTAQTCQDELGAIRALLAGARL